MFNLLISKKVLIPVIIILIAYYYNQPNVKNTPTNDGKKPRVNINNFVKPPPCEICRGDNGVPVVLTVSLSHIH